MKTNKSIRFVFILLLALPAIPLSAQELGDILFGKENTADYMGQYNYNGKRKNGFGIERYKNGSLYLGDFVENKISGRGMFITKHKGISNVEGAAVYIGNWRAGKKEGKGRCYNEVGRLIYEGKFINDKPVGSLLHVSDTSSRSFRMVEINKILYLGEISGNIPDGMGLMLQNDGTLTYGAIKSGIREGIGIIILAPDMWEVGKWTNGKFTAFNDSRTAQKNIQEFRLSNKKSRKETWGDLFAAVGNFAQAGVGVATIVHDINSSPSEAGGMTDTPLSEDDIPSGKSIDYYQAQYKNWEFKAKNTYEDRVRHKITAQTAGDGRVANSDAKLLRTYQKAMRSVRLTAKKNGFHISQSKYEIVSF